MGSISPFCHVFAKTYYPGYCGEKEVILGAGLNEGYISVIALMLLHAFAKVLLGDSGLLQEC